MLRISKVCIYYWKHSSLKKILPACYYVGTVSYGGTWHFEIYISQQLTNAYLYCGERKCEIDSSLLSLLSDVILLVPFYKSLGLREALRMLPLTTCCPFSHSLLSVDMSCHIFLYMCQLTNHIIRWSSSFLHVCIEIFGTPTFSPQYLNTIGYELIFQ